jgi:hypothetical protein
MDALPAKCVVTYRDMSLQSHECDVTVTIYLGQSSWFYSVKVKINLNGTKRRSSYIPDPRAHVRRKYNPTDFRPTPRSTWDMLFCGMCTQRMLISWLSTKRPRSFPETSVKNYHFALGNVTEEGKEKANVITYCNNFVRLSNWRSNNIQLWKLGSLRKYQSTIFQFPSVSVKEKANASKGQRKNSRVTVEVSEIIRGTRS